jgi:hypothetical protein
LRKPRGIALACRGAILRARYGPELLVRTTGTVRVVTSHVALLKQDEQRRKVGGATATVHDRELHKSRENIAQRRLGHSNVEELSIGDGNDGTRRISNAVLGPARLGWSPRIQVAT